MISQLFRWIAIQITTQWIAIITAVAGFIAWRSSHAKLIINTDKVSTPIAGILLDDGQSIMNKEHGMQHLSVWLINPSDSDLSYFDLRVVQAGEESDYYTLAKFSYSNDLKDSNPEAIISYQKDEEPNELLHLELPKANYGTVVAHGFVQIDILFYTDQIGDGMVLMKLAQQQNLFERIRHSRRTPRLLRPKIGYILSETKETALSFQVRRVQKPENDN